MGAGTDQMMPPDDATQSDDPEQIRAEIEQTREQLSGTIDAIQAKLSPDNLKEQALEGVEQVRDRVMETARDAAEHAIDHARDRTIGRAEDFVDDAKGVGYTVIDTIRDNPVPAALAALGIGWLLMEGRNSASQSQSYRRSESSRSRDYRYSSGRDRNYD